MKPFVGKPMNGVFELLGVQVCVVHRAVCMFDEMKR